MNSVQEQKLIDYKNDLKQRANEYFDWSSINENKEEQKFGDKTKENEEDAPKNLVFGEYNVTIRIF